MRSVADQLRRDTVERVRELTIQQRIDLALSLGDADLDLYVRTSGRRRDDALRDLRAGHARGRAASCATPE